MDSNRRKNNGAKAVESYLLTGHIFCGKCNAPMVGCRRKANGKVYISYECNGRKRNKNCDMPSINRDFIEGIVIDYLESNLFSSEGIDHIISMLKEKINVEQNALPREITAMENELADLNTQIDNMVNILMNTGTIDSVVAKLKTAEENKKALALAIEEAKYSLKTKVGFSDAQIREYITKNKNLADKSREEQKRIIGTFVHKVIVHDGPAEKDQYIQIESLVSRNIANPVRNENIRTEDTVRIQEMPKVGLEPTRF